MLKPAPNSEPANVSATPAPLNTCKFKPSPLPGTPKPLGRTSCNSTSNASAPPVFSTTMANLTLSPASTPLTLLSIGVLARVALVKVPVNGLAATFGAVNVTGPTPAGENSAPLAVVETTPLVKLSVGSVNSISTMAVLLTVFWPVVP